MKFSISDIFWKLYIVIHNLSHVNWWTTVKKTLIKLTQVNSEFWFINVLIPNFWIFIPFFNSNNFWTWIYWFYAVISGKPLDGSTQKLQLHAILEPISHIDSLITVIQCILFDSNVQLSIFSIGNSIIIKKNTFGGSG